MQTQSLLLALHVAFCNASSLKAEHLVLRLGLINTDDGLHPCSCPLSSHYSGWSAIVQLFLSQKIKRYSPFLILILGLDLTSPTAKRYEPWFPQHRERDTYVTLLQQTNPQSTRVQNKNHSPASVMPLQLQPGGGPACQMEARLKTPMPS